MRPLPPTGRLRREQAPVTCAPAMASDHTLSREHATTQRAGPLREGDGTRSRGLIIPSRRTFSTAPAGRLVPLVPTRDIRSSHQLTSAQRVPAGKRPPRGHQGGGLSEPLRPTSRPVRQRSGLAVTEEWRPGRRRATWLPEEEQATQRDAPVVVDAAYTHGAGTAYAPLQPCVNSTRLGASSRACRLSDDAQTRLLGPN